MEIPHKRRTLLAVLLTVVGAATAWGQPIQAVPGPTLRIDPTIVFASASSVEVRPMPWLDPTAPKLPRYRFMADPRRWPRLFANTTECTLSLNPITRRHWWQG